MSELSELDEKAWAERAAAMAARSVVIEKIESRNAQHQLIRLTFPIECKGRPTQSEVERFVREVEDAWMKQSESSPLVGVRTYHMQIESWEMRKKPFRATVSFYLLREPKKEVKSE